MAKHITAAFFQGNENVRRIARLKLTPSSLPSVLFWGDIKDLGISCKLETEERKISNLCATKCKLDSFSKS